MVTGGKNSIAEWEISGLVEYIKSGQKQGDMLPVVPEGAYAARLGNEASVKQRIKVWCQSKHIFPRLIIFRSIAKSSHALMD